MRFAGATRDFQFHLEVAGSTGKRHFADLMTHLKTMIIPRTRVNVTKNAPERHVERESIYRDS